jgi:hypothetical protein
MKKIYSFSILAIILLACFSMKSDVKIDHTKDISPMILFPKDSATLSEAEAQRVDSFIINVFNPHFKPTGMSNAVIKLTANVCVEELKHDSMISYKRCEAIIKHIEKNNRLRRLIYVNQYINGAKDCTQTQPGHSPVTMTVLSNCNEEW